MKNLIPGKGWSRPWKETAPHVWLHVSGTRCIPVNGGFALLRMPSGRVISAVECSGDLQMAIRRNGGNRRRGGLAWAALVTRREGENQ